eukprot:TRINITY_DN10883_c0_g1_i1.p1 TRINITY_DN10883_c0_g1~~TRINITY_DN10883_c0_g1_i1.p1  ORF type:complete len:449 (+),score=59.24 TRINITY_DN10883_c0_g1_i1:76-1422(+)
MDIAEASPTTDKDIERRDLLSNQDDYDDEGHTVETKGGLVVSNLGFKAVTVDVDGGRAWLIVMASFATHFIVLGIQYTFGVFLTSIEEEFDTDRSSVSWIVTINNAMQLFCGMITGRLVDRYGFRIVCFCGSLMITTGLLLSSIVNELWQLYITFGIICGVGNSLAFLPSISNISQWFVHKRGLATGIAVSGSGIGQITMAQVSSALLDAFGWRVSFVFLAGMAFVILALPSCMLKRRLPTSRPAAFSDAIRDRRLHIIIFSCFLGAWGYMVPFVHVVPYGEELGLSSTRARNLLSYMGAASTFGRISIGAIADKVGRRLIMQITMLIIGIATMAWPFTTSEETLILYCVVFGLFAGGYVSLQPTLLAEYFDVAYLASISGVLYFFIGIGVLFGAPLAGAMYETTGTYKLPGLLGGGLMVLSSVAFSGLIFAKPPASQKESVELAERR